MDQVRVQAIQLRRKRQSISNLQVQFKLRLPGIAQPAQFHLSYIAVHVSATRIGTGDRQKITRDLATWQQVFRGGYELRWETRGDRHVLTMAFVHPADGRPRAHSLGWCRHKAANPTIAEQSVRSRLLELAGVHVEINWIAADNRFRELVEEIAASLPQQRAANGQVIR